MPLLVSNENTPIHLTTFCCLSLPIFPQYRSISSLKLEYFFICIKSMTQPPADKIGFMACCIISFFLKYGISFFFYHCSLYFFSLPKQSKYVLPCLGSKTIYFPVCFFCFLFLTCFSLGPRCATCPRNLRLLCYLRQTLGLFFTFIHPKKLPHYF
jgi:hypothetical protein